MCEDCLKVIMSRLMKEDILILNHMKKIKCINNQLSLDKLKIITEVKQGLTDFKATLALTRLEVTGLITPIFIGRSKRYYLSDLGARLLELYAESIK